MKQKLLQKTLLLLFALIAGSTSVWADSGTVTITISSFTGLPSGGAAYNTYDWTANGVSGKGQIFANTSSTSMQMNGSNANGKIIYNTTAIPGSITKINIIKASGSNRSYSVYGRTTAYTGSGEYGTLISTANIQDGTGRDYTVTTGDYNYFVVVNNASNAAYLASVTVTYEAVTKHTLSSAVSPAESGTVTLGSTSVGENKKTTITATPNEGYRFVNWTVTGTGASVESTTTASTTFTMGTTDATVTANFEVIPSHTLSYEVSPVGAGTVVLGSSSVLEGATTTATASANAGYKFTGWSIAGTGSALSDAEDNPVTITMGTANTIVTANFAAVTTYPIHWSVNGTIVGTDNVEENTAISFAAPVSGVPEGYVFQGWVVEANKITGTTDTDPSANYVTSANSTAEITYYAVMAVEDPTLVTLTASHSTHNTTYADNTYTDDEGNEWSGNTNEPYENGVARIGLRNSSGSYLESPTFSGNVKSIIIMTYNGSSTVDRIFNLKSTKDGATVDLGTVAAPKGKKLTEEQTAVLTGKQFNKFFIVPSDAVAFSYIKVTYATASGYCTTVPTATITLASACTDGTKFYGTYSSSKAFVVPADLTVSEVSVIDGELLVEDYDTGDIVPASTGVMVSSTASGDHTITLATGGTSKLGSDNMLKPSGDAGISAANMNVADTKFYRLTMHNGTTIGFWWGAADGAAFDLAANKAYLAVPNSAMTREGFWFDDTTGIQSIDNGQKIKDNAIYDLSGRRVENPTKGIYIMNGKKFVVK